MPRRKYPWNEWLNGETWELRKGVDFQGSCEGVRAAAFQAAKQKGKRLKTRVIRDEDGEGLAIRAYEEGEEFPWETARAGPGKYPWDEWLNGETWELRRGRDFQLRTLAFISIARMTSKRAGKKLKTRIVRDEDGEGVAMRAYEEGDEFPWETAGQAGKYPWNEWLDGETWELREGKDFQVSCENFRITAHNAAVQRGKRVKTRIIRDEDGEGLAIRAYEEGEEFPWETARAGPGKYPWDEWLNGETWELRRGRDFQLRTLAFISIARMTSKRAGKKLKTRIVRDEDGEGVAIRAYEEGEEFPWKTARARPGKYPWGEWLNGGTWELREGKDFQVSCDQFRTTARNAAARRGKRVKTRVIRDEDGEGVVIRAYEEGEETARPGRPGKYPWDEWLNGETWELRRGKDFQVNCENFRTAAWKAGGRRGKRIKTRIIRDENGEGLAIRAYED